MAITKLGSGLLGGAMLASPAALSALAGGYRADSLSSEEKRKIKKYYNLDDDASLPLRNAGRAAVGGLVGSAAGVVPAIGGLGLFAKGVLSGIGEKSKDIINYFKSINLTSDEDLLNIIQNINKNKNKDNGNGKWARRIGLPLALLSVPAGGIAGTYYATNKYSKNSEALK